ncbi:MAG: hypothetical protein ILP16_09515, partial [Spirochaetales bacterium]|nr:hypothetical protein [Spirochaetales bacterium]
ALVMGIREDIAPVDLGQPVSTADVISMGERHFSLHLLPMLCLQKFSFDGNPLVVKKADHYVDARERRSEVWTF